MHQCTTQARQDTAKFSTKRDKRKIRFFHEGICLVEYTQTAIGINKQKHITEEFTLNSSVPARLIDEIEI